MATHQLQFALNNIESGVYPAPIGTLITATNGIGNQMCLVFGTVDLGGYGRFKVPPNYAGTPVLVIEGYLDGAPGASDTLGFGVQGLPLAPGEAGDQAYGSEDAASASIGSGGDGHSDEDLIREEISLSNIGTLAVGDEVQVYVFRDDTGANEFSGNFLLTGLYFQYAD